VVCVALLLNLLGACYLRRRRERALRRAVEGVEQGIRLKSVLGSESEEQMVLDGKDVVVSDVREVGAWDSDVYDGGRKGMSLPRRVW
jgi:hypothetical protein